MAAGNSIVALLLVALNGPEGHLIWVNPGDVVSVRATREGRKSVYGPQVRCVLQMLDGKTVAVVDTCNEVREKLEPGQ